MDTNNTNVSMTTVQPNTISTSLFILRAIFILFTGTAGVVCNLLSLRVLPRTTSLPENNRILLMSLGSADLGIGVMTFVLGIPTAVSGEWLFGTAGCKSAYVLTSVCFSVSIMTLICLNLDQYVAITRPLHYPMLVTRKRLLIVVALLWLSQLSSPAVLYYFHPPIHFYSHRVFCVPDWTHPAYLWMLLGLACTFTIFVPVPIMSFTYGRLICITRTQLKAMRKLNALSKQNQEKSNVIKGELKAILSFVAVTVTYLASWMPFMLTMVYYNVTQEEVPAWVQFTSTWTALSSSWWDVTTLIATNRGFRISTKRYIQSYLPERFRDRRVNTIPLTVTSNVP